MDFIVLWTLLNKLNAFLKILPKIFAYLHEPIDYTHNVCIRESQRTHITGKLTKNTQHGLQSHETRGHLALVFDPEHTRGFLYFRCTFISKIVIFSSSVFL